MALTDEQIMTIAHRTKLLAAIRLAAACHPDRIPLEEATMPANTALLAFARAVLQEDAEG